MLNERKRNGELKIMRAAQTTLGLFTYIYYVKEMKENFFFIRVFCSFFEFVFIYDYIYITMTVVMIRTVSMWII